MSSNYEEYENQRVKVIHTDKSAYKQDGIVGLYGTVIRVGTSIAVKIDGKYNTASREGVYWFRRDELKIIGEEINDMTDFNYVAIVNLVDDCNKKDYGFALYDTERELIENSNSNAALYVVINARGKDNRVLGIVKSIMTLEEYGKSVTDQVIGVVNMDGYNARVKEENRLKELAEKKVAIEKELEKEINKRKSVEYYEEMAKKYSDNPRLTELVNELKELGE